MAINGFDDERPLARRRRISVRFVAGSIVLGIFVGLVLTIIVLIISSRGQPPRITAADLAAAKKRWSEHGARGYDIDIEQSLGISGKIHVEVRSDRVVGMTINRAAAPPRLWDNWSVAGIFEIIQSDLDRNVETEEQGQSPAVFQQAEFDPVDGLPQVYRRTELSTSQAVEWRITAFRARPDGD